MKPRMILLIVAILCLTLFVLTACTGVDSTDDPTATEEPSADATNRSDHVSLNEVETVESLKDYFLSDLNRESASRDPDETIPPPGTEVSPEDVPHGSYIGVIGRTYMIRLTPEVTEASALSPGNGMGYLHYTDPKASASENAERLTVYLEAPGYDLILTFETTFGNTAAFREVVSNQDYFPAKLIACRNAEMNMKLYMFGDESAEFPVGDYPTDAIRLSAGYTNHLEIYGHSNKRSMMYFCYPKADNPYTRLYMDFLRSYDVSV